jgi:hypothetical protein
VHIVNASVDLLAQGVTINPTASANKFKAFLVLCLGIVLLLASVSAIAGAGRKGNNAKAASIASASMIGLIPGVIGVGIGALAFGAAFLGWAVPGLS